jgi:hypothetical protein
MTGVRQKKWPMRAVWIGLVPICALSLLGAVGAFIQSGSELLSVGVGYVILAIFVPVIPFVFLWAAFRLNKRWQEVPSRLEIGLNGLLLLFGFAIGVVHLVYSLRIVRSIADAGLDIKGMIISQGLFFSAIFVAWIGYFAIFIGRLRLRKQTEEVFS